MKKDLGERKQIEESLPLKEQKYRDLVESASDWIWETNSLGQYTYVSPRVHDILGYKPEEILGKTPFDLMPAGEAERVSKVLQHYSSQKKSFYSLENLNLHKKGRRVILETSGVPFFDAKGNLLGYRGIDRDITKRKQLEEALNKAKGDLQIKVEERTAKLQKANEELSLRATILDMAKDAILLYSPNGVLLYANEAATGLYGYSKKEFNRFNVVQLIPEEDLDAYLTRIKTILETGEISAEVYHQRKDGSKVPVETHSRYMEAEGHRYIISIIRDMTEHKFNEEQLKNHETQLLSIFDALTEGVILVSPNGRIIRANMAEAKIVGLKSPDERIGKHFRDPSIRHIYPDGRPLPIEETAVVTAINRKRSVRNLEMGLVKENGSIQWLNVNAVPVIGKSGEVTGVVRTMTDITEQKRLQDEREQFTKRLLEVQEEERKRISRELHDDTAQYLALMRLEMDSLISAAELLPPKLLSRLKKLQETTGKALQEVRRFSHELRPSVLEHFGLVAALELIVEEFNTVNQTRIEVFITGSERRLSDEVELAFFRIAQEAMNNIRKHSGAAAAKVSLKFSPDKVKLTIGDNGKGFDTRKKSPPEGRQSLGLIGMRERAHLIGASLKVKSKSGQGTVVTLVYEG